MIPKDGLEFPASKASSTKNNTGQRKAVLGFQCGKLWEGKYTGRNRWSSGLLTDSYGAISGVIRISLIKIEL